MKIVHQLYYLQVIFVFCVERPKSKSNMESKTRPHSLVTCELHAANFHSVNCDLRVTIIPFPPLPSPALPFSSHFLTPPLYLFGAPSQRLIMPPVALLGDN